MKKLPIPMWTIVLILCTLFVLPFFFYRHYLGTYKGASLPISGDPGEWGTFGDFIGGMLNPLFAAINIIVLVYLTTTISRLEHERDERNKQLDIERDDRMNKMEIEKDERNKQIEIEREQRNRSLDIERDKLNRQFQKDLALKEARQNGLKDLARCRYTLGEDMLPILSKQIQLDKYGILHYQFLTLSLEINGLNKQYQHFFITFKMEDFYQKIKKNIDGGFNGVNAKNHEIVSENFKGIMSELNSLLAQMQKEIAESWN